MANLFEGAPPAWLQSFGESANSALDNKVMQWIYNKATQNKPSEGMQAAGEMAYNAGGAIGGLPANIRNSVISTGRGAAHDLGQWRDDQYVNNQPLSEINKHRDERIMANTHPIQGWQPPEQFGAGFDQFVRNKIDSLGDASSMVAKTAQDSLGSLAEQIYAEKE